MPHHASQEFRDRLDALAERLRAQPEEMTDHELELDAAQLRNRPRIFRCPELRTAN
jgi:hypothetical protein